MKSSEIVFGTPEYIWADNCKKINLDGVGWHGKMYLFLLGLNFSFAFVLMIADRIGIYEHGLYYHDEYFTSLTFYKWSLNFTWINK